MEPVVKEELLKFGETVSVKGISRILKARNAVLRILWLLAVLLCFGLLLWQISTVLMTYFRYPVESIYQEGTGRPVFPDVTICKLYSMGEELDDPGMKWDDYSNATAMKKELCPPDKFRNITKLTSIDDYNYIWSLIQNPSGYFTSFPPDKNSNDSERYNLITSMNYFTWEWDISDAETVPKRVWSLGYNWCYTLQLDSFELTKVRGLTLILYIDNFPTTMADSFFPTPTQSRAKGVRVTIHAPGTRPNPKNGLSVGSGTETTLHLLNTIRTRLSSPHGNCTTQELVEESDKESGRYSTDACYDICLQQQFIDACNCINGQFHATPRQLRDVGDAVCGNMGGSNNWNLTNFDGVEQLACMLQVPVDLDSCKSSCPEPCKEYQYDIGVSSAPWPHVSTQLIFYDQFIGGNQSSYSNRFDIYDRIRNEAKNQTDLIRKLQDIHLLEDNFIQLNVIFDQYSPMLLTEVPSLTGDKLLSLVGGALSLWLGITVMTLVEFVQFVFDLMEAIQKRKKTRSAFAERKPSDLNRNQVPVAD